MKCLIIAAGQGTRLRTRAPSKPLALVNGVPLIEHIVRAATAGGASGFVVVTGYEAAGLEAFLPGLAARIGEPIETVHNADWLRPNGVSVLAAAARLTGEFIILMSDHLFDPTILRNLIAAPLPAALMLAVDRDLTNPELDLDDATKVTVGPHGEILRIGKLLTDYDVVDTGIFRATPALFDAIRTSIADGGQGSLSEGVQVLADSRQAHVFEIGGLAWIDVDDAPALDRAEAALPTLASASGVFQVDRRLQP